MLSSRVLLLVAAAAVATDGPPPLRVIRTTPAGSADPASAITVTFDRPVAGSLDRTVDPKTVLALEPEVRGVWDWRDPVTVRFRPAAPLHAGLTITVTVRSGVTAMDGSALAEPYRFSFRVSAAGPGGQPRGRRPERAVPPLRRALHPGAQRPGRLRAPRPAGIRRDEPGLREPGPDSPPPRRADADRRRRAGRAPRGRRLGSEPGGRSAPAAGDPGPRAARGGQMGRRA